MKDDMRGLFFIMKGQYRKGAKPSYESAVSGDVMYIGGHDPSSEDTVEWYMLRDCKTFKCVACSNDLNKVLESLSNVVKKNKGSAKRYFRSVKNYSVNVSPVMMEHYEHVFNEYGVWYEDQVSEVVESAYTEIKDQRPVNKSKRLMAKNKVSKEDFVIDTPHTKVMVDTTTPKKVKPKVKLGVRKLNI